VRRHKKSLNSIDNLMATHVIPPYGSVKKVIAQRAPQLSEKCHSLCDCSPVAQSEIALTQAYWLIPFIKSRATQEVLGLFLPPMCKVRRYKIVNLI